MRKIFTFLFAALMSVGMYATTVVTITQNDFPRSGSSFTKDGVTVSAGSIDGSLGNLTNGGSFSTTLGNFTEIEVTANGLSIYGAGWNGTPGKMTWKGNAASSVSFGGNIMGMGMGVTLKFTIGEPTVAVTGVTLDQNEAQMTVGGETLTLTATVNPNNATDQSVSWSTSDANVATVENGVVTAVAAGNATITVTTTDGSFTATCAVTVTAPEPQPATTVVTITNNDFPEMDVSFTKDGVTVSADWIDNMQSGNLVAPGSFSTTLGNFTKIEVNAGEIGSLGEGWSGNSERQTWTGNASSVSFSGDISGLGHGITIMCTIEPASTPEPAKYYVVGNMTEWAVDENYEMNPNIYAETEEYFYALDLTTTSEFKVVKVEGENQTWYPTGMGNNYGQNGEITEDAEYTIYFRPNYNGGEDWFYNCIYVSKNEPEPAGEVTVVFAANNKTVERTVTLPHTFKCSWDNGMDGPDELDIIIHELYNDYYYCNSNMNASGSDQVEVGTEEAPKNDYITIKGVFEGTATVTGDYFDWITGEEGAHNYSITISIKGDEPQVERELTKLGFNFPSENIPADNDIEMAGTFEEGTMWMEKIIATGWFVSYDFVNAAEDETFKLRSKSNNDLVLCQFIPANDGEGGKWVQAIFTFGNYWDDDTWHGTPCKLIEKDLSDAAQYAWMEGMPEPQPTGIENIVLTEKATKRIVNGQLLIEKNGKLYNVQGAEVK